LRTEAADQRTNFVHQMEVLNIKMMRLEEWGKGWSKDKEKWG